MSASTLDRFLCILRKDAITTIKTADHISTVSYQRDKDRLIAHNLKLLESPIGAISGTTNDIVIVASLPFSSFDINGYSSLPLAFPGINEIANVASTSGMSLLLSTNSENNTVFTLHLSTSDIATESLLHIGRDFLAPAVMKASSFTLPDNETATELVATPPTITERTEGEFTFIDLTNHEQSLYIIKGPTSVTITNETASELSVTAPFASDCASSARARINIRHISELQHTRLYELSTPWTAIWSANELAQTKDDIRICW
ncbi:MAG: hypothetical protein UY72_C0058G0001 [Candidatus Uhrbacteria bacterium GW2011_GWD2_52_7]|uniref:Uncharacterized protein n=1 Tax=Candidatus Uhrbacteria bacterium GW2011_GWD2_52_7 TaxID=1618989 RepID=A0A0G2A983_9BACT|nr:MAG: hypothetical protein UY72_C0058G0001 [Candidatus Uhrbacteria bacterium GW2011_GWD2_52_7]